MQPVTYRWPEIQGERSIGTLYFRVDFTMADEREPIDTLVFECKGNSVGISMNFRL
jgi:hypothetical protein